MDERTEKALAKIRRAEVALAKAGREMWHRPLADAVLEILAEGTPLTRESLIACIEKKLPGGPMGSHALGEAIARLRNEVRE